MKTKPTKLLLALMLGLTSMAFVSTSVLASEQSDKDKSDKDAKDAKDSKDSKDASDSASCTSNLIQACGLDVILTTCEAGKLPTSAIKSSEGDDKNHESKAKDSDGKNDRDRYEESHRDHANRSGDAKDGKIAVCHRMGGAEVSLIVANDGYLSGHSKHALDTVGRCEDFDAAKKDDDSKEDKDKDTKMSASDAGYSRDLTTTQISCLSKYNTSTTSITIPSSNQGPSRGGARTLH